jgi:hypothetical protein
MRWSHAPINLLNCIIRRWFIIPHSNYLQGDYTDILRPRVWSDPAFPFDDFAQSLQTLIEVRCQEIATRRKKLDST